MSGLVGYGSSDEEEDSNFSKANGVEAQVNNDTEMKDGGGLAGSVVQTNGSDLQAHQPSKLDSSTSSSLPHRNEQPIGPPAGPIAGPTLAPNNDDSISAPSSPYSANRATLRNLTLPTVPNLDIPPSPPGSPPPGLEKRIEQFLKMKKQGVHFNEKLASSSAVKNPSLLSKLMAAAGLDEADQYATTLPTELWDPSGFPDWAYKGELAKAQREAQKRRDIEAKGRDHIDFVSSSGSGTPSRAATPGNKSSKISAAERIMAGVNRDSTR